MNPVPYGAGGSLAHKTDDALMLLMLNGASIRPNEKYEKECSSNYVNPLSPSPYERCCGHQPLSLYG